MRQTKYRHLLLLTTRIYDKGDGVVEGGATTRSTRGDVVSVLLDAWLREYAAKGGDPPACNVPARNQQYYIIYYMRLFLTSQHTHTSSLKPTSKLFTK